MQYFLNVAHRHIELARAQGNPLAAITVHPRTLKRLAKYCLGIELKDGETPARPLTIYGVNVETNEQMPTGTFDLI